MIYRICMALLMVALLAAQTESQEIKLESIHKAYGFKSKKSLNTDLRLIVEKAVACPAKGDAAKFLPEILYPLVVNSLSIVSGDKKRVTPELDQTKWSRDKKDLYAWGFLMLAYELAHAKEEFLSPNAMIQADASKLKIMVDLANDVPFADAKFDGGLCRYQGFGVQPSSDPGPTSSMFLGLQSLANMGAIEYALMNQSKIGCKKFVDSLVAVCIRTLVLYSDIPTYKEKLSVRAEKINHVSIASYETSYETRPQQGGIVATYAIVKPTRSASKQTEVLHGGYNSAKSCAYYSACNAYSLAISARLLERILTASPPNKTFGTDAYTIRKNKGYGNSSHLGKISLNSSGKYCNISMANFRDFDSTVDRFLDSTVYLASKKTWTQREQDKFYSIFQVTKTFQSLGYPDVIGNFHWRKEVDSLVKKKIGKRISNDHFAKSWDLNEGFAVVIMSRVYRPIYR